MVREFRCPACGETERLHGRSTDGGIVLTCESCHHEWLRDVTPRCRTCGGTKITTAPRVVLAGGRATVESIVGRQLVPVCADCDLDAVQTYIDKGHPLPPGYVTAAARP
jgi:hypothetical protein